MTQEAYLIEYVVDYDSVNACGVAFDLDSALQGAESELEGICASSLQRGESLPRRLPPPKGYTSLAEYFEVHSEPVELYRISDQAIRIQKLPMYSKAQAEFCTLCPGDVGCPGWRGPWCT